MAFNENTRVKIPAILHLCRLGYEYISLSKAKWNVETNIFTDIFEESIQRINPDIEQGDVKRLLENVSLVLDNEAKGSTLGEYVSLNGYKIIGSERQEFLHQYTSNFGQGDLSAFASIRYNILYNTDFGAAFWAYIFPLLILVTVVIISPSLPGSLGDVRLAIPTTILLTLIFLQIGYKADLPALAYVTYLDWLYIYAYVVSASLFILFCWGTNAHANALAQGNEESMVRRINRVDFLMQAIAFVGLVMILATGLLFEA